MKGFKPFPVLGLACLLGILTACSGNIPQNGAPALNFLVTKMPDGAVTEPYTHVIVASGGVLPYTYSITDGALPPGLTLATNGTVDGTPTTAGTYYFTVKVVDSQTPTQAYNTENLNIVVNPPLSIPPASLANAVVGVAYNGAVTASGGVKPYAFSVTQDSQPDGTCIFTTTCKNNHGLTLNADGTITGTPTGPVGTYDFTVQASDTGSAVATANFSLSISGKVQGNYAFSFNGFNDNAPFYMVGSLVADGNGNITGGMLDRNGTDSVGLAKAVPITGGTYTIGSNSLGTMTIISSLGTFQYNVSVSTFSDSRFILADPNFPKMWGSGVLKKQTLSGLTLAHASFAFGFSGADPASQRYAGAGYFVVDTDGVTVSSGMVDTNDNGTLQAQVALTGSVSSTIDPTTGRGTVTFNAGSSTVDYAFYVVSLTSFPTNELLAVQTDSTGGGAPVSVASIVQRGNAGTCTTGAFSSHCLSSKQGGAPNGSAFEVNAVSGGGSVPDISLGVGNFDGSGAITGYSYDENNGGTLAQNNSTGTYAVDQTTGRVTVTLTGFNNPPVWYLIGINSGFVVGTDLSVTQGLFEPQTLSQPVTNLSFFGNFYGGSASPVLSNVTNEVDSVTALPTPPPSGIGARLSERRAMKSAI